MTFAPTNTLANLRQSSIEERLSKSVGLLLTKADPFWLNMFQNKQAQLPLDLLGRDWEYITHWHGSMTGVIEPGKPRGDFPLYGDTTTAWGSEMHVQNLTQVFPDALQGANLTPYSLGVPIRTMLGNIMFTLGEKVLDANRGNVAAIQAPKMTAYARHWTHMISLYLYLSQNDFYKLGTIANISAVTTAGTTHTFTFQPSEEATSRFSRGMSVDIYDSTGATRRNLVGAARVDVKVRYVDKMTNTVQLISVHATAPSGWDGVGVPINTDVVVARNSRDGSTPNFTGIAGLNSYIKSGATGNDNTRYILGGERNSSRQIDCSILPEFKSFFKSVGGPLTESLLTQYLEAWMDHYSDVPDADISQLLAGRGVWHNYHDQRYGLLRFTKAEVSNVNNEGIGQGFKITVQGKTFTGHTSNKVEDGVLYGVPSQWKRIVPPDPPGMKSLSETDGFVPVRLVAPELTGTESVILPIYDSSASGNRNQVTEGYQMPCWLRMNIVPAHPAGLKLTDIDTTKAFSD